MLLLSVAREVFSAVGGSADQSAEHVSSEALNGILISSPAHQGGEIRTRGREGKCGERKHCLRKHGLCAQEPTTAVVTRTKSS